MHAYLISQNSVSLVLPAFFIGKNSHKINLDSYLCIPMENACTWFLSVACGDFLVNEIRKSQKVHKQPFGRAQGSIKGLVFAGIGP